MHGQMWTYTKATANSARSPDAAMTSVALRLVVCGNGRLLPKNFRGPLPVWTFDRVERDDPGPPTRVLVISRAVEKYLEFLGAFAAPCAKWVMTNS
jgi:hypothetical protein